jgi:phospholipid transport system substrate-binding protein
MRKAMSILAGTSNRFLPTLRTVCAALALCALPALSHAAEPAAKKTPPAEKSGKASAPAAAKAGPPPAESSPLAELRRSNATLKKTLAKQSPSWSPERDAQSSEVRKVVGQFLDFEELAHRALARHWEPLTPKQRTEFVATLRELVERNYLKQLHGQPDYDLKFEKETKEGGEAMVNAVLSTTSSKGKKVSVNLDYKLVYKSGKWVVYDVITDDQSLLENYRAEFNKIINKDGFDALLKRMKKKLDEKND